MIYILIVCKEKNMTFSSHRVKCDCLTFTNFSWAKRTNWIKTADFICTFHKQLDSKTNVMEKCQTWNKILFFCMFTFTSPFFFSILLFQLMISSQIECRWRWGLGCSLMSSLYLSPTLINPNPNLNLTPTPTLVCMFTFSLNEPRPQP